MYKCETCEGRGRVGYGMYSALRICGTCRGVGHLQSSPESRKENRERMRVHRAKKRAEKKAAAEAGYKRWKDNNGELYQFLTEASEWSHFAALILNNLKKCGTLTIGQLNAVEDMRIKDQEYKARKGCKQSNGML